MSTKNLKNQVGQRVSRFRSINIYGLNNSQFSDGHTGENTGTQIDSLPKTMLKGPSPTNIVRDTANNDNSLNTSGLDLTQDLVFRNITPGTCANLKSNNKSRK